MSGRHHFPVDGKAATAAAAGVDAVPTVASTGVAAGNAFTRAPYLAGGTDLLERLRLLPDAASDLVHLRRTRGFDDVIKSDNGDLILGAFSTLHRLIDDVMVRRGAPLLWNALRATANPQVRAAATLAGALAQQSRCWYFRHADALCLRKGGEVCFAKDGENDHHAIFDPGSCISVHPSTVGAALLALDGRIVVMTPGGAERTMSTAAFFDVNVFNPTEDNTLAAHELIVRVELPGKQPTHTRYLRASARRFADWADVEVCAAFDVDDGVIANAHVVLGAVARAPRRATGAEQILNGARANQATFIAAAKRATDGAKARTHNAHKVTLVERLVLTALEEAVDVE